MLWAILIKEPNPPAGVEPLEWFLLTTVEINSFEQACQFIQHYSCRWLIERFHFVLKSGCQIEKRQFEYGDRLICFLSLANVVAWRLLWQTYLSRVESDLPCTLVMTPDEWKSFIQFYSQNRPPPSPSPDPRPSHRLDCQIGWLSGPQI